MEERRGQKRAWDDLYRVAFGMALGYVGGRYLESTGESGLATNWIWLLAACLSATLIAFSMLRWIRVVKFQTKGIHVLMMGISVTVGLMVDAPTRQWMAHQIHWEEPSNRLLVEGKVLGHDPMKVTVASDHGLMQLRLPASLVLERVHHGDILQVLGTALPAQAARNPGAFDGVSWMVANGLNGVLDVNRIRIHHRHAEPALPLQDVLRGTFSLDPVHAWVLHRIDGLFDTPSVRALAGAMLLGDRRLLTPQVVDNFRHAGLMHLLAVSGLHFGCVVLFSWLIAGSMVRRLALPAPTQQILLSLLVSLGSLFYATLAGWTPSVQRSFLMLIMAMGCRLRGHTHWMMRSLVISALLILCLDPAQWRAVGTHLSFAAVTGIGLALKVMGRHDSPLSTNLRLGINAVITPMLVSTAAFMGTLPVLLWHMGWVPVIALLTSPPAVAVTTATLTLAITAVIMPVGGSLAASVSSLGFKLLMGLSQKAETLSFAIIRASDSMDLLLASLPMVCLFLASTALRRYVKWMVVTILLGSASILVLLPRDISMIMLDVGQGDALIIDPGRIRSGPQDSHDNAEDHASVWVMDTGPGERSGSLVRDALEAMGYRSINLVLSHADSDHTGGTGALEKSVHVASRSIPWNVSDSIAGAPKTLLRGDFLPLPSHMRGYVLHPFEPGRRNTHSLVILLVSGRTGILLTGDMEKEEEHQLVATYGRLFDLLNVRILKVAHHGSSTSSSHELVQRFKPHLALISAGVGNPFGHPHKDVIDRLHEAGAQTLATMDLGAIRLRHITSRPRIDCHARGTWRPFRQGSTCQ